MLTDSPLATHRFGASANLPIVLIHGFPLDSRMWYPVARRLSDSHQVLVVDLPGAGGSPAWGKVAELLGQAGAAPSIELAADAVARTVRDAYPRAVIGGLSMGGYVALALAERHPDLVAGLVLVDTKTQPDDGAARHRRETTAQEVREAGNTEPLFGMAHSLLASGHDPELSRGVREWIGEQDPAGTIGALQAMAARPDRTRALQEFGAPVCVIVGEDDKLTPPGPARAMAESVSGSYSVIAAAGHLAPVEQPEAVANAIAEFVTDLAPVLD